jgi:hypothetical protein
MVTFIARLRTTLTFSFIIVVSILVFGALAHAANPFSSIKFPIAELGKCGDFNSCKTYCDVSANADACTSYAESHGLAQHHSSTASKVKVNDLVKNNGGPGGCTSENACRMYCDNVAHIKECATFGKAHGLISSADAQQANKIAALIDSGIAFPGGCTTRDTCETYCLDTTHADECVAFAQKSGLLGKNDLAQAKKFRDSLTTGQTPGGCKSGDECRAYCNDSSHRDACIAFGKKVGFVSDDQEKQLQSVPLSGPGGCTSADTCDAFCNTSGNQEICATFAQQHGFDTSSQEMHKDQRNVHNGDIHMMKEGDLMGSSTGSDHKGPPPVPGIPPQQFGSSTSSHETKKLPPQMYENYQGQDHGSTTDSQYNQRHEPSPSDGQNRQDGPRQSPPPVSSSPSIGAAVLNAFLRLFGVTM